MLAQESQLEQSPLQLSWPRYLGEPLASGQLRTHPEDFRVVEELGFEPDGEGEHLLLELEKTSSNTQYVVRQLADWAGCNSRDVGYSGLKDRHAVCRQWFSVPLAIAAEADFAGLESDQLRLCRQGRHRRKLRRGVHRRNHFEITLRQLSGDCRDLEQRCQRITDSGVPNYFGEQRFGRNGHNVAAGLQWFEGIGRKPRRPQRDFYLSALRSAVFNHLLAQRLTQGDWPEARTGDVCLLGGSRSRFVHDGSDESVADRIAAGELQLALPLWGAGGDPEQLPTDLGALGDFLVAQGLDLDYRPARLSMDDFFWQFCDDDSLTLRFSLPRGGFATAVLRELLIYQDMSEHGG